VAVFAFFMSLLMPNIGSGASKKISYSLTGFIILCFVIAGGLAFIPIHLMFLERKFQRSLLAPIHQMLQQFNLTLTGNIMVVMKMRPAIHRLTKLLLTMSINLRWHGRIGQVMCLRQVKPINGC
jgi:hypothetical protein